MSWHHGEATISFSTSTCCQLVSRSQAVALTPPHMTPVPSVGAVRPPGHSITGWLVDGLVSNCWVSDSL